MVPNGLLDLTDLLSWHVTIFCLYQNSFVDQTSQQQPDSLLTGVRQIILVWCVYDKLMNFSSLAHPQKCCDSRSLNNSTMALNRTSSNTLRHSFSSDCALHTERGESGAAERITHHRSSSTSGRHLSLHDRASSDSDLAQDLQRRPTLSVNK